MQRARVFCSCIFRLSAVDSLGPHPLWSGPRCQTGATELLFSLTSLEYTPGRPALLEMTWFRASMSGCRVAFPLRYIHHHQLSTCAKYSGQSSRFCPTKQLRHRVVVLHRPQIAAECPTRRPSMRVEEISEQVISNLYHRGSIEHFPSCTFVRGSTDNDTKLPRSTR